MKNEELRMKNELRKRNWRVAFFILNSSFFILH
jgi:hypothetical protein